jgi:hypothetical protein
VAASEVGEVVLVFQIIIVSVADLVVVDLVAAVPLEVGKSIIFVVKLNLCSNLSLESLVPLYSADFPGL